MWTEAFGESTMSRTQVQVWFYRFEESPENVNDRPRMSSSVKCDGFAHCFLPLEWRGAHFDAYV